MSDTEHNQESESLDRTSGQAATEGILRMDPMSDVLETIRLRGALFFLWEPAAQFGIGVANGEKLSKHIAPGTDCLISYHIVTQGPCWAAVNGEEPILLETGDILVLPRGDAYKIASSPQYPSLEDETNSIAFFKSMANGNIPPVVSEDAVESDNSKLICGFLGCDLRPYNPLLSTLPPMIRIPAPTDQNDPLSSLVEFALSETGQVRGGERCLLLRLSEVMFIEVMRRYLRSNVEAGSGWLDGLLHPVVGKALGHMHKDISRNWNLQSLADAAGSSRSTLADHFTRLVGIPPMQYLTKWRMQVAANRLMETTQKIYAISNETGYDSEAAFSRAFKRVIGMSPKAWRERS